MGTVALGRPVERISTIAGRVRALSRHLPVSEPHVIELDSARACRFLRHRRRNDLHRSIEQLEDAFARRHRRLQNVVLLAEVHDRAEEALRVLRERDQNAERSGRS